MGRIELVTFLCEANINRSPVAQCIAEAMAVKRDLGVKFTSAGLIEPPYSALSPEMAWALRELGYEPPRQHIPTRATAELLQRSDLVLCFERSQVEQIRALKGNGDNAYTLPEYAGFSEREFPGQEIPDPARLIRATPLAYVLRILPSFLKPPFYDRIGHVHPADEWGVYQVHMDLVRAIESCVERAIEKVADSYNHGY